MAFRILFFLLVVNMPVIGQHMLADSIRSALSELTEEQQVELITKNVWRISRQNLEDSKELALKAISISKKNGWRQQEIDAKSELVVPLYHLGEYEMVFKLEREKLNYCDSIGDQKCIGNHLNYMANSIKRIGEYGRAHAYLDQALSVCTTINDSLCLSTNHDHRGVIYMEEKKYEEALQEFLLTLSIRENIKDSVGIGYVCNNLSWVYSQFGEYEKALAMLERARVIRESMQDKTGLAVCINNIGEVYFQTGAYETALTYFEEALSRSIELNFTDLTRHIYEYSSQAYMQIGQFEKAHTYLKSSYELKDSLLNADKTRTLLELETKYESEKRSRQLEIEKARNQNLRNISMGVFFILIFLGVIGFLIYKNRQQKRIREQESLHQKAMLSATLSATEDERSRIAKDLHDGIGQQLSALKMGFQHFQNVIISKAPQETATMARLNQILTGAADDVRDLSHQMMPRSLSKLGLEAALHDMLDNSFVPSRVNYEFDTFGQWGRLSPEAEIGIFRIAQELVNNILKHANATEVNVQLSQSKNGIMLRVEDNGVGFDFETKANSGKGLMNLKSRVTALNGTMHWESSINGGTTIVVRIPKESIKTESQNDKDIVD